MRAKHAIVALAILVGAAGCGGSGDETADQGATAGAAGGAKPSTAASGPAPGAAAPAAVAAGAVIQAQEVDGEAGLLAELTEATRKDGVLTIKVRFRNNAAEQVYHSFETGHGDYSYFYVTAGEQKYFVLKDTEGAPLAPKYLTVQIEPGTSMTWWAKFPAPPATETTFDFIMPDVPPFEDVPITDR